MTLSIGDTVPNRQNLPTTKGTIQDLYQWMGNQWLLLTAYPRNFTAVGTTELIALATIQPELSKRSIKTLVLSTDTLEAHNEWLTDIEKTLNTRLTFPLVADDDRAIATQLMLPTATAADTLSVRTVLLIDPMKKVRLNWTMPITTGINTAELLRITDSLLLATTAYVATPVNWQMGQDCLLDPTLGDKKARSLLLQEAKTVTPYLRTIKQSKIKRLVAASDEALETTQ